MPIYYPAKIRRRFADIDLELLTKAILNDGFVYIRDGGFSPDDEPFKYSNYRFYKHPKTGMRLRIGYDYPIICGYDKVFEICYCEKNDTWWTDITPDCRKTKWRKIMKKYQ